MTEFELLIQGFEYDAWANRLWLKYLIDKKLGGPDQGIMEHILGAQDIWYRRCFGTSVTEFPKPELSFDTIGALNSEWTALLTDEEDNDPVIHYQRLDGTSHHQRVSRIAHHVIDHGVYHRGELRGLCRGRGDEDFPETGLMGFYFT